MSTNRREFIAESGALLAELENLAACAKRTEVPVRFDIEALHAEIAEEILSDYAENATSFGIDNGTRVPLKARLSNRSAAGPRAIAQWVAKRIKRPKEIAPDALAEAIRIDLEVARTAPQTAAEGLKFPYSDVVLLNQNWFWRNAPYVVAQNTGAFLEIPRLPVGRGHRLARPPLNALAGDPPVREHQRFERIRDEQGGGPPLRLAGPGLRIQSVPRRHQTAAAKAQKALGEKVDLRTFDDTVVKTGGVPMVVLARKIDGFFAACQIA